MPTPTISLDFCRAELNAPTCVIPNGHMLRIIGGVQAPIGLVSPGGASLASKAKMAAYAHTFAAGPRMLAALKGALEYADNGTPLPPGSLAVAEMRAAVAAAENR
jgi:hypothetical protein